MGRMTRGSYDDHRAGKAETRQAACGATRLPWRGRLLAPVLAALLAQAGIALAQVPGAFDAVALQANAASGNVTAELQLGTLEYVGIAVVQDYTGALDLLKQAGNAGNAAAQGEAGFLYQTGSFAQGPPPPDLADAAIWYEKSAAFGDPWGQFALGALYQSGQGVPKDAVKAATLFAKAAAQGITVDPASFPLAQMQKHYYAIAYQLTGQTQWVDTVSIPAGGGQ